MQKETYITIETDSHDGFSFVKNHEELPNWLVDRIESELSDKYKPPKGETQTIGKVVYDPENQSVIETINR